MTNNTRASFEARLIELGGYVLTQEGGRYLDARVQAMWEVVEQFQGGQSRIAELDAEREQFVAAAKLMRDRIAELEVLLAVEQEGYRRMKMIADSQLQQLTKRTEQVERMREQRDAAIREAIDAEVTARKLQRELEEYKPQIQAGDPERTALMLATERNAALAAQQEQKK